MSWGAEIGKVVPLLSSKRQAENTFCLWKKAFLFSLPFSGFFYMEVARAYNWNVTVSSKAYSLSL